MQLLSSVKLTRKTLIVDWPGISIVQIVCYYYCDEKRREKQTIKKKYHDEPARTWFLPMKIFATHFPQAQF